MPRAPASSLSTDQGSGRDHGAKLALLAGIASLHCQGNWLQAPSLGLADECLEPRSRIAVETDRWHVVAQGRSRRAAPSLDGCIEDVR